MGFTQYLQVLVLVVFVLSVILEQYITLSSLRHQCRVYLYLHVDGYYGT